MNDEFVYHECGSPLTREARFCWLCGVALGASLLAAKTPAAPVRTLAPYPVQPRHALAGDDLSRC
jgi:hypothetical protein